MKAMILAAGRGERLRPLTDACPKPLLVAGGRRLIEYRILDLVQAGVTDIVINYAWLGEQIVEALGNGERYGARIRYSPEPAAGLETGGGIRQALPLLGADPFIVVNADIWTDYPFAQLPPAPAGLAHLVLVDNPEHHPGGDFRLAEGKATAEGGPRLTFSGIGVYRPELFANTPADRFPLAPLLIQTIAKGEVSAEHYQGSWMDIGTRERLYRLDARLGSSRSFDVNPQ